MEQSTRLLWQYQQIDLQVANVEKKLRASATRKKLMQARDYIINSQNVVKKMEADAGELRINYDSINQRNKALNDNLNDILHIVMDGDSSMTLQEVERMKKEVADIGSALSRQETELRHIVERLDRIRDNINKIQANLPRAKKDYTELKQVYDKEAAVIAEETQPYRQQLSGLEAQIPQKLMQRYQNVKKTRINPLAPVRNSRCSGCNMELPSVTIKQVQESDLLRECENCGRMLFMPED